MRNVILVIVILLVLAGGAFFLSSSRSSLPTPANQEKVLSLSFADYEGKEIALSDFAGKPLVINSWAAWCPFCREELKDFSAVQKELGDTVVIIAIDRAENLQTAKSYSDALGVTQDLVFLLDPDDSFYRTIGGFSMPETIFLDKTGTIVDHKRGPMKQDEIKQRIEKIL
ncbi:MAG: TlpA family protein disulfide reductase [Candidatus Wildermuthbacteria bacterium]|nr:TlpA family protein disulfide reductase [Candidatus Wildermuthbacteria bacterium]